MVYCAHSPSVGGDLQQGGTGLGQVFGGCDDGQHDLGQVDAPLRGAEVRGQELQAQVSGVNMPP